MQASSSRFSGTSAASERSAAAARAQPLISPIISRTFRYSELRVQCCSGSTTSHSVKDWLPQTVPAQPEREDPTAVVDNVAAHLFRAARPRLIFGRQKNDTYRRSPFSRRRSLRAPSCSIPPGIGLRRTMLSRPFTSILAGVAAVCSRSAD